MLKNLAYAVQLATALEEGSLEDGTHLGVSDSEYVARILREIIVHIEDGAVPHTILKRPQ